MISRLWYTSPNTPRIDGEVQRLTQALTARIQELEERYAQPLPELEQEAETFTVKMEEHLKSMGMDWK